jgi:hypothetical protein
VGCARRAPCDSCRASRVDFFFFFFNVFFCLHLRTCDVIASSDAQGACGKEGAYCSEFEPEDSDALLCTLIAGTQG